MKYQGVCHQVAKIYELENLSLWQKLNSLNCTKYDGNKQLHLRNRTV